MRWTRRRHAFLLAAGSLFLPGLLQAASLVPPRDMGEMVARSDAAVLATAGDSWSEARGQRIFTITALAVERVVKGAVKEGMTIAVESPGGQSGEYTWEVPGAPRFSSGQTYFLLLHRSPRGFWQPETLSYGVLERTAGRKGARLLSPIPEVGAIDIFELPGRLSAEPVGVYLESAFLDHVCDVASGKTEWDSRKALAPREQVPISLLTQSPPAICNPIKSSADGNPARWFKFDSGQGISISASDTGDSSLAGGGFTEVQNAVNNWNGLTGTTIKTSYAGKISFSLTCTGDFDLPPSSTSVVVFNDPCSDIADLKNCSGTLAFGGPYFTNSTQTFDGTAWHNNVSWFVVVNNGSGCLGSANYTLMLTHELGHGLGFDHVTDPGALMNALCCNPINSTDRTCAQYQYPAANAPCVVDATTACLNNSRFRVRITWTKPDATSGSGQAVALTSDTAYAWFFSQANVEVIFKVVDGRAVNGKFWVFIAGLTNVQVVIEVTDTETGAKQTFTNPQGVAFQPVQKTDAFSTTPGENSKSISSAVVARAAASISAELMQLLERPAPSASAASTKATAPAAEGAACVPDATTLCLNSGRFQVRVTWVTTDGRNGSGQAVALTADTGYFWFFSSNNVEMIIKVVDGRVVNGKFWAFAGGLTNVNVVITVTDTATGAVRVYVNPLGTAFAPIQDTGAF